MAGPLLNRKEERKAALREAVKEIKETGQTTVDKCQFSAKT